MSTSLDSSSSRATVPGELSAFRTNTRALLWTANVGRIYQVQHRDAIDSGTWSPATGEISATKTNVAVELPLSGSQRFYRLVRVR